MTRRRLAVAVGLLAGAAACGSPPPRVAPVAPRDLVVLAPHPEDEPIGAATVNAAGTTVDLTAAGASTTVVPGRAPATPVILPAGEIARIFGDVLAVLPPPARRYMLYFELGNDTLTPGSQALVPAILALVAERGQPDVAIIGHTDTTGAAPANVTLGLRRAALVRDRLLAAGLDAALIEVSSHGESNPLEPTPDNTGNARNRRVEVTVR